MTETEKMGRSKQKSILMESVKFGLFHKLSVHELDLSEAGSLSERIQIVLLQHEHYPNRYRAKVGKQVMGSLVEGVGVPHALLLSYALVYPELDSFSASSADEALEHVMRIVLRNR
jgi:hypothetical protein